MTNQEYIKLHRKDDVYKLALGKAPEGVDLQYALQQIAAYQTIEKKIPSWTECDELVFPPKLSLEQSSSEVTALLKAALIKEFINGKEFDHIDLTGGMGIDCYFIAQNSTHSHYVEQNEELCRIAQHNFTHLNSNITVYNMTAEEFLNQIADNSRQSTEYKLQSTDDRLQASSTQNCHPELEEQGQSPEGVCSLLTPHSSLLIYLDPARRGNHGEKLVSISDCQPDVVALLPQMFELTDKVVVKLSPMLDITRAINELAHIEHLYVVSVGNECKELLLFINREYDGETQIHAINLKQSSEYRLHSTDDILQVSSTQNCHPELGEQGQSPEGVCSFLTPHSSFLTPNCFFSGTLSREAGISLSYAREMGRYLYEPFAAHLKSGLYKSMAERYGVEKLHQHSHLYTSVELVDDFPGRKFEVEQVVHFDKKSAKSLFKSLKQANLTTRNFPLTVNELRSQFKIKEGGAIYVFATTLHNEEKVLVMCKKV